MNEQKHSLNRIALLSTGRTPNFPPPNNSSASSSPLWSFTNCNEPNRGKYFPPSSLAGGVLVLRKSRNRNSMKDKFLLLPLPASAASFHPSESFWFRLSAASLALTTGWLSERKMGVLRSAERKWLFLVESSYRETEAKFNTCPFCCWRLPFEKVDVDDERMQWFVYCWREIMRIKRGLWIGELFRDPRAISLGSMREGVFTGWNFKHFCFFGCGDNLDEDRGL